MQSSVQLTISAGARPKKTKVGDKRPAPMMVTGSAECAGITCGTMSKIDTAGVTIGQ